MTPKNTLTAMLLAAVGFAFAQVSIAEPNDHFITRDTAASLEEMVSRIEGYAEEQEDWVYLSTFGLKGGEVTAVKICYLPIGGDIFAAGMHVAAMMPCGHVALYEENGRTHLTMLHPKFMTTLNPDPNLEQAVAKATPAFETMLRHIWR